MTALGPFYAIAHTSCLLHKQARHCCWCYKGIKHTLSQLSTVRLGGTAGGYCAPGCACANCYNHESEAAVVQKARQVVLAKDPKAFETKVSEKHANSWPCRPERLAEHALVGSSCWHASCLQFSRQVKLGNPMLTGAGRVGCSQHAYINSAEQGTGGQPCYVAQSWAHSQSAPAVALPAGDCQRGPQARLPLQA